MRILLVGFSLISPAHMLRYLEENHIEGDIMACSSELSALELVSNCSVDIVMAQLDLAGIGNGARVMKEAKKANPNIYTLSIAREEDFDKIDPTLESGIDDFITIPFMGQELNIRLRKAFRSIQESKAGVNIPEKYSKPQQKQHQKEDSKESVPDSVFLTDQELMEKYKKIFRITDESQEYDGDSLEQPRQEEAKDNVAAISANQDLIKQINETFGVDFKSRDRVLQEFREPKGKKEPPKGSAAVISTDQEISSTAEESLHNTEKSQGSNRSPGEQREQDKKPETKTKTSPEKRMEREVRDNVVTFSRAQEIGTQSRTGRSGRTKRNGKDEKKGSSKILKAAGIMGNVVFGSLLVVMAVLAFFLVQGKMHGGIPSVAGYQMYVALSGSMNPAFDTGSLVFIRETDPTNIVAGDIITFKGADSDGMLTTHRVVEVNTNDGLTFTTRGDANNVNDPMPVPAENLVGRVHSSIPYMGYVMGFAQTRQGLIFLIFIPGFLVIAYELRNIYAYLGEMDRNKNPEGDVRPGKGKSSSSGSKKVINS